MAVLKDSWEDSKVVPRLARCFGSEVSTERGVKQGDVTSPLFFNLMIDAILRAVEVMMTAEIGPHVKPTLNFYADDGRLGGDDPALLQSYLDKFLELFAATGLEVNAIKTVSMTSRPNFRWPAHKIGAYNRRLSGEPVEFEARLTVLEECEVCARTMQHRCLKRHMKEYHSEVMNFEPPSLYSPSPARRGPRHFNVTWNEDDEMVDCPVPLCEKVCPSQSNMRLHFSYRHYDQTLSVNGDTRSYEKCELCMMYAQPANMAKHQDSEFCRLGNTRRQTRAMVAEAMLPAPTFYVDGLCR
jgi:ferredoxin